MASENNTAEGYCNVTSFDWRPDNVTFDNKDIIRRVHDSPRFGHTSNITYLITGTDEQARDYLKGVLACAIAIGVFFVVWSLILIALRCLGPYRVGMLSGKVPQVIKPDPSHSEESNGDKKEESIQKWEKKMRFQKRNRLVSRIIVLFCSLGIVVSALVMISLGAKELRNSISTTFEGLDETQENVNEAISMIDNYISLQNKIVLNITEFLNTLNESCPNLCSSLNATGSQCNFTDIPNGDQLESIFSNSKLYIIDKLEGYISDLQDVYDFISKIESTIKSFGWAFIVAAVFAGLLAALNLLISYGVISAWRGSRDSCVKTTARIIRSWVLVPIFGMLVFFSWLFSMVFVIGSIMSADTCYGNPDDFMTTLYLEYAGNEDDFITKAVVFYIEGCPVRSLSKIAEPNELINKSNAIQSFIQNITILAAEMANETTSTIFEETCGGSPSILASAASTAAEFLCQLWNTLVTVQTFFACDNWRPLYTLIVYDALCYQGIVGFTAMAASQICIVLLSMVMFTMRAAFIEIREDEEVLTDENAREPEPDVAADPLPDREDVKEATNEDAPDPDEGVERPKEKSEDDGQVEATIY